MVRSRLIAVALLGFGVVLGAACAAKQQNGQECLRSDDCESARCIQYVCVDPNASHSAPVTDSGTAAETGGDTGVRDTGPADTGTADTGAPDTGTAADTNVDDGAGAG